MGVGEMGHWGDGALGRWSVGACPHFPTTPQGCSTILREVRNDVFKDQQALHCLYRVNRHKWSSASERG